MEERERTWRNQWFSIGITERNAEGAAADSCDTFGVRRLPTVRPADALSTNQIAPSSCAKLRTPLKKRLAFPLGLEFICCQWQARSFSVVQASAIFGTQSRQCQDLEQHSECSRCEHQNFQGCPRNIDHPKEAVWKMPFRPWRQILVDDHEESRRWKKDHFPGQLPFSSQNNARPFLEASCCPALLTEMVQHCSVEHCGSI